MRVCERREFRLNVGKSKVTRCSRCGNGIRMHVILNGDPLEKVDCFKYHGVKVALGNRGMTVEAARQCAKDRKEWRALVHM